MISSVPHVYHLSTDFSENWLFFFVRNAVNKNTNADENTSSAEVK